MISRSVQCSEAVERSYSLRKRNAATINCPKLKVNHPVKMDKMNLTNLRGDLIVSSLEGPS